jgi:hypothetical protein
MTLLERIISSNKEVESIRSELERASNYYNVPYPEMVEYYNVMKPKSAEKFIEGWVATLIGGQKILTKDVPEEFKKNDVGDIWVGETLEIGINNIELKSTFRDTDTLGGGQFRFYDPVPWYLLFKVIDTQKYELFLLTKRQLINEIVNRATYTGFSAYQSSQGSGVINKLTQSQKIDRLYENLESKQADKIGWNFNTKTEPKLYQHFKDSYKISPKDVKYKVNSA